MAGITTKATLETEVANWLHRTDLSAEYDTWEQLAEEMFKAPVRSPKDPEVTGVRTLITRAASTLSTSNPYISKPADYLEPYSLYLTGVNANVSYVAPGQIRQAFRSGSGQPRLWSVLDVVHFDVVPDSAYAYELAYYNSASSIVGGITSAANTILTTYPMVYLSSVLHFAFDYNGDDENAGKWLGRYKLAADAANRHFGEGMFSRGPIAAYTDYSTP